VAPIVAQPAGFPAVHVSKLALGMVCANKNELAHVAKIVNSFFIFF
jgi:hypothetical protein